MSGTCPKCEMLNPCLVPLPAQVAEPRLTDLCRYANHMAALFGGTVYLVGSALQKEEPRDWDIRCVISDVDFVLRYCPEAIRILHTDPCQLRREVADPCQQIAGIIEDWIHERHVGDFSRPYWRWADEMHRYSNTGRHRTGLLIDFQVHPVGYAQTLYCRPHSRLDTRDYYTFEDGLDAIRPEETP